MPKQKRAQEIGSAAVESAHKKQAAANIIQTTAPRKPLNFSIDSIMMQQKDTTIGQIDSRPLQQHSPASSRSASSVVSDCLSPSPLREPLQRHHDDESSSSSRVSTPISPGCSNTEHQIDIVASPFASRQGQLAGLELSSGKVSGKSTISGAHESSPRPANGFLPSASAAHQSWSSSPSSNTSNGNRSELESSNQTPVNNGGSQQNQAPNQGRSGRGATTTNHLLRQPVCTDPRLSPFECHLDNLDLWHRFHPLDTEMIITKQGR